MGLFGSFLRFFGLKRTEKADSHQAKLIQELKEDHQDLINLYVKIGETFNNKKYKQTASLLKKFEEMYKLHILLEDNKFYPYMKKKFKNKPDVYELITNKQEEMNEITNVLTKFVKKYQKEHNLMTGTFLADYEQIKNALLERVKFEESKMYPLYDV